MDSRGRFRKAGEEKITKASEETFGDNVYFLYLIAVMVSLMYTCRNVLSRVGLLHGIADTVSILSDQVGCQGLKLKLASDASTCPR